MNRASLFTDYRNSVACDFSIVFILSSECKLFNMINCDNNELMDMLIIYGECFQRAAAALLLYSECDLIFVPELSLIRLKGLGIQLIYGRKCVEVNGDNFEHII